MFGYYTPPKFNSLPLKNGWFGRRSGFLLAFGKFSGASHPSQDACSSTPVEVGSLSQYFLQGEPPRVITSRSRVITRVTHLIRPFIEVITPVIKPAFGPTF